VERVRNQTIRNDLIIGKNLHKRFEVLLKEEKLNQRSRAFLTDIHNYFMSKGGLTPRMYECFEKAESKFSPEAKLHAEQWHSEFDTDKRELFRISAEYYQNLDRYFKEIAEKFLNDKTFVPTRQQYEKMVNNKFAQKIIKATQGVAKYEKSQLVQLRKNVPNLPRGMERECLAIVLKANSSPVTSDARGAKKYQILPFGHSDPIEVEERHIKKYRGKLNES